MYSLPACLDIYQNIPAAISKLSSNHLLLQGETTLVESFGNSTFYPVMLCPWDRPFSSISGAVLILISSLDLEQHYILLIKI